MNTNTKKKLVITGASISVGTMLLTGLYAGYLRKDSHQDDMNAESTTSSIEEVVETSTEVSNISTNETTNETTSENLESVESYFTVEAQQYTNPLTSNDVSAQQYEGIAYDVAGSGMIPMIEYGFDNDVTVGELRNQIYNVTGVMDNSVTLSDVSYFQGTNTMVNYVQGNSFYQTFSGGTRMSPYSLAYVRAILQLNGWRFGIDEIPYDYICQRFPEFTQSLVEVGDLPYPQQDLSGPSCETVTDPLAFNNMYDYDFVMLMAIFNYNSARMTYIYDNPYGSTSNLTDDVLQVRDAETGRNVLVPTEEQYYQIMEDINSIPGCENVDIAVVETRENFYESYGYYPEDLINDQMIYEGNASYQMTQGG